ncbi:ExeM/NucH family extracellular endonuclease [Citricoccus sp.]|uniref:ExeM/NucH family extracellular endonuclease n=1 Tax=Citricoccus sp. TaxID=1978372 RepID=UPI0028BE9D00|nr:ExeM/NucH family extracellular endonuclease [Citricoccus sp.]
MTFSSRLTAVGASMALLSATLVVPAQAATAAPSDDAVIINEAYTNGGSANAAFTHKFVELYNPSDADVSLDGWSIQYRSATGEAAPTGVIELSGTIKAGGYYLVQGNANGNEPNGEALPAADAGIDTNVSFSGTNGTLVLANQTEKVSVPVGSVTAETEAAGVVDLLGYGTSNTFETTAATGPSANNDPKSMTRTDFVDTDDNSTDFTATESVTPTNAAGETAGDGTGEPEPEPEAPTEVTSIAEIQGTGAASEMVGRNVMTQGVVTAVYSTGGFNGYYLQTAGSGGEEDATPGASDAIFVYSTGTVGDVALGDHVQVVGEVSEYYTGTQLTVRAGGVEQLDEAAEAVKPTVLEFPADEETKEAHEGMLLDPSGMEWTITDNYDVNAFGSLGLAPGTSPLDNPTSVANPGAEAQAVMAENAEKLIVLDDGASTNFRSAPGNQNKLPYLNIDDPARVGSAVTFSEPVILDYRYEAWNFQPTQHLTHENAAEVQPATFENTREAEATPEDVGGNVQLASFNVLNYFTTLGEEFEDCDAYEDHEGNPIVTDFCDPRGAYNQENFLRQQEKIVAAINGLDASMVALEEIENSAAFGNDRDEALAALVKALNEKAGTEKWAYAASPAELPTDEDVIRNAFIYQPEAVETVGESQILTNSDAFSNAREPLAQTFRAVGEDGGIEGTEFVAITNHFKSKGSGSGAGNEDSGDGQGSSNADRVAQAESLVDFAEDLKASEDTDQVFLMGDFNAYEKEDPITVLEAGGYVSQGAKAEGEYSYTFDAGVGSLDGIFASPAADETVTGSDIWMINANEAVALEYSRYNYTPEQLYAPDQWRSSDHNPILVGVQLGGTDVVEDFSDNQPGSVYYAPVRWMQAAGVTTGYTDGTYRKAAEITRGESVAFLQRYLDPDYTVDPADEDAPVFPDVPAGAPHFTPIAWAADDSDGATAVSQGYTDGNFRPGQDVTRAEFVTFLYRAADPEGFTAPEVSVFPDVPSTGSYYEAISWAAAEGLVNGYHDGDYRPYEPISRGEVAKVMHQHDVAQEG